MPWLALLRTSGAAWAVIPTCAWMWYFTRQPDYLVIRGSWEAATAQTTLIGIIPASVCAAAGTWEAIRLKRSRLIDTGGGTSARSSLTVALAQLRIVWCTAAIFAAWALICASRWASGGPGLPDMRVLALLALLLGTYTVAGYAIGWIFPGLLAIPCVAVGTYLWLAYPAALEPLWLRQLTGTNLSECCTYSQTLTPRALWVPALVLLGLAGSALVAIMARSGRNRLLAVLPLAVAAAVAVPLAMPLGLSPSKQRDTSAIQCTDGAPRVCMWPEQRGVAEDVRSWVRDGAARLSVAGVEPPATYTLDADNPDRAVVLKALVSTIMPIRFPDCGKQRAWAGRSAYFPVGAWLEITAGTLPVEITQRIGDGGKTVALVDRVRALPAKAQLSWYRANRAALTECDREPQLEPGGHAGGAP